MPKSAFDIAEELLEEGTQAIVKGMGERTSIGTQEILAVWSAAQGQRVQTFLDEEEWKEPAYDVVFDGRRVLDAPWSLQVGSSIVRVRYGWNAVVRKLDVEDESQVTALCVLVARGVPNSQYSTQGVM